MPPVRITAGLASEISAPTAIPMAVAGDNSCVWAATGISWKRLAHRCTPSRLSPTGWQVVKSYRRRRMVGVTHRVVFGTHEAIEQRLAKRGWKINTAFAERLNLDLRQ